MQSFAFYRYFLGYLFHSKTRQKLLFIAVVGLFLSSFSLLVIQGIMGGLQKGLIARSKNIHGHHLLKLDDLDRHEIKNLKELLKEREVRHVGELEVEVLLKHHNLITPAKIHGVDEEARNISFLADKDFTGLVMGSEVAAKLRAQFMDNIQIIAPGVTDSIMGEVPRFMSDEVSDYLFTELLEVDDFEIWSRLSLVQNLLRKREINQIRIFEGLTDSLITEIKKTFPQIRWLTWDDMNEALVWSLDLETKVMLFLFISMSFLVAIAITSGLLIFYAKIRRDLMSFWILGMSQSKIISLCYRFTIMLSAVTVVCGAIGGYGLLLVLEKLGHRIVPDIFVERGLPVSLDLSQILMSLSIPFLISIIFSYFSFSQFRKENQSFVDIVRSLA
ncbi:MAG: hypothetical protein WCY48_03290 [Candidatus Caldatribacteriota bacterium]